MEQQKKVVIATFGSLGDLHPFIALAHALAREGFAPVIATSAGYADYLTVEGLAFAPVRPDARDLTARLGLDMGEIAHRVAEDGSLLFDSFLFDELIFPHLRESYDDLMSASDGAVAVVAHALAFSARLVAEKRGLPLINVLLSPMMLYSAYDPPLGTKLPVRRAPSGPAEIAYNRFLIWSASHALAFRATPLRRLRRELGLPRRYGLDMLLGSKVGAATIGLYSPTLGPPQPDHGSKILIAGHTFHDRYPGASVLTAEVEAFLADGDAPIVFTLGSFVARKRLDHYRTCIAAAQRVGRRAVILAHKDDVGPLRAAAPGGVHVTGYAPHSLIFPRASVVVHHGGIGTTGQALRAGKPQVVTPYFGDQYDNAARLARLGVSRMVSGDELSVDKLERELRVVLSDQAFAARARAIAEEVNKEAGATVAARRIAHIVGNQPAFGKGERP